MLLAGHGGGPDGRPARSTRACSGRHYRLNPAIELPLRNREKLAVLTREEFTAQFGPSAEDYQALILDGSRALSLTWRQ